MAELKNEPAGSRHRWWRRSRSREAEHENEQPELAESRRDYQDLVERFEATVEGPAAAAEAASQPVGRLSTVGADGLERQKRFRCSAPQAIAHLNELNISGDLGTFVAAITDWARDALSFDLSGRQFLKQIYEATNDPEATARLLVEVLHPPRDSAEAHRKINDLAAEVRQIRSGLNPMPGRSAFLASYFWALQDRTNCPISWPSATKLIEDLTKEKLPPRSEPADRYQRFQQAIQEFDDDVERFERVAVWWARNKADTL